MLMDKKMEQRQTLPCATSFTLALLFRQHSGLDQPWWSATLSRKGWPAAQTTTMQIESLSHSSLAWLCTCKTTHSGGSAPCSCQKRDSVDEQGSWHPLPCPVAGSAVELFAGYQARAQEWILASLPLADVGVFSAGKAPLGYALCASSLGPHFLTKASRNPWFHGPKLSP